MGGRTSSKCTMLKDRDYDVTPYIIAHLYSKCTRGRRRSGRCSVDMVGEECEVGETSVVVSSVTWSVQW